VYKGHLEKDDLFILLPNDIKYKSATQVKLHNSNSFAPKKLLTLNVTFNSKLQTANSAYLCRHAKKAVDSISYTGLQTQLFGNLHHQ
jgi:hypothetical protein